MKLNDDLYQILKWLCLIFLPALGVLYFALAEIWGLPYGQEALGTISAIATFLGTLIGISTHNYYKDGEQDG